MQFPVPQFTDVEDRIIGPLTLKQFGIVFGAGIVLFLAYSITKSVFVLVVVGILVGLPALGVAFARPNGRPMYTMIGSFINFILSPKVLVFKKEAITEEQEKEGKKDNKKEPVLKAEAEAMDPKARIKEINRILEQKAREEKDLFK